MYIKAKNKILRKYDSDFWNFLYSRKRKNKFFVYFRLSLIHKILFLKKKKFFFINTNNILKHINFINKKNNLLNYKRFFKKSKFFVKKVYSNLIKLKSNKIDSLFGIKNAYERYTKKVQSPFSRFKIHLKQIILHYNNLTTKKLKTISNKSITSKMGSLNFFLYKLETRLDSIILRLNVGNKFFVRN